MAGDADFGALLRRYRRRSGLSQEELAARALVSTRAVSDLERGVNARPRLHTAVALAEGLALDAEERATFERYARPDSEPVVGSPPLAGRARPPHTVDSFVDSPSLDDLLALVGDRSNRLVTLIGPGGAGKTRLAIELAHRLDGTVAFVALAPLDDPTFLAVTVGNALGAEPGPARTPLESLIEHLAPLTMTVILDNLEQVVDAATDLAAVIRTCPGVTIVATSRVPLHIGGEVRFPVRPLDEGRATRLFLDRAAAAGFDAAPAAGDEGAVAELCRRLDGLPLAIELAAARSGVVAPADMLHHLDQILDLLSADRGDAPEHHRSMRAALEWSYRLLPPPAQDAFAALGAFATSASAEAAKAVWGIAPTAAPRFFDLVQTLAEAHLVNVEAAPSPGELRIDLFEIARQFARQKLEESDNAELVYERLAQHAADLVARAEPELYGPDMLDWLDLLDRELPNLRAVGNRLAAHGGDDAVDTNLRLVAGLQRYWDIRSRWYEGAAWLRDALAMPGGSAGARGAGRKALAVMQRCVGKLDDAEVELERAHDEYSAAGDERGIASCLNNRAVIVLDRAQYERASELLRRSLAMLEALGDDVLGGVVLNNLGLATLGTGDLRAAFGTCRRGHRALVAQGNLHGLSWVEDNLASVLTLSGHPRWAVAIHERTIRRRIDLGDENGFVWSLEALAEAWTGCGEMMLAGRALGFVAAHRERLGTIPVPMFVEQTERRRAALVARIGETRFRQLWDEGSELSAETVRGWFDS
ncbi:ATP-binding protein [Desertimonas flava]|uniref:ATP-binding protein n=1 Tax=Desertimonas flava TaxID=2064846 RepID=UPI0013C52C95|nr:helix-turn-helix domain-containing protein [Desertimonas flava]